MFWKFGDFMNLDPAWIRPGSGSGSGLNQLCGSGSGSGYTQSGSTSLQHTNTHTHTCTLIRIITLTRWMHLTLSKRLFKYHQNSFCLFLLWPPNAVFRPVCHTLVRRSFLYFNGGAVAWTMAAGFVEQNTFSFFVLFQGLIFPPRLINNHK